MSTLRNQIDLEAYAKRHDVEPEDGHLPPAWLVVPVLVCYVAIIVVAVYGLLAALR